MALYTYHHDAPTIVAATRDWIDRCLIQDGSVFSEEHLNTLENFNALDEYFVQRPDEGSGSFYEKLHAQLSPVAPSVRKLMAEVLWALFLFPSNISEDTKREGVCQVWGYSGETLHPNHPMLADAVLDGVGSAGMGVNSNRWRELSYMIAIGQSLKAMAIDARRRVLTDYDPHMDWMATVPQEGNRQFRHMLRYLLFPERVERMSSNGDRQKVLAAFGVAPTRQTNKWSDRQFDDAMLKLRQEQEQELGTTDIDFYVDPLRARWKQQNDPDVGDESEDETPRVNEPMPSYSAAVRKPRNLIYYGPPGTGKTWRLQRKFEEYTEKSADVDHTTWLQQLVTPFGWRAVIAAALAGIGEASKADVIEAHDLIAAKALQRQRKRNVRSTVWNNMQAHTSLECLTVNVADKRAPYLFTKDASSLWSLLPDWQEADSEAAELFSLWNAGQQQKGPDVHRYRVVTFHPSYTYEDFVVGLRPVVQAEGAGEAAGFRMVDGVFKQICADARANPSKRYALFIDEINRAYIAKVFGELITLIEPDKRARYDVAGNLLAGMEVQLPGTGRDDSEDERFGVPENLDIIGTMNTADRSIALLDIALRRRFEFQEITPDYDLVRRKVSSIELATLLQRINDRIEFLADRDRLIGHAYFMRVSNLEELQTVFRDQIIPLLQEYFFDDFGRVELVLSTENGTSPFLDRQTLDAGRLFGLAADVNGEERTRFKLTPAKTWSEDAFRSLYESPASSSV